MSESTTIASLLTPAGQRVLDSVDTTMLTVDPLQAATTLRKRMRTQSTELDESWLREVTSAALTQARLRSRAVAKLGPVAERLYFTSTGLEQATRGAVARYRARRIARLLSPHAVVADLCCGIGIDLLAMARAGLTVRGMDIEAETVRIARANLAALGLDDVASVTQADVSQAGTVDPSSVAAVFCDPARRDNRRRIFDPDAYVPPWSTAVDLAERAPAACLKVAPGIDHGLVPPQAGAEWISVGGELKEAALWFGDLAPTAPRQATLLPGGASGADLIGTHDMGHSLSVAPGLGDPPVAAPRRYLYEPDAAVIRAGLVAEAAARVDGALLDPQIAYITSDHLVATPFCRSFEITDVLPFAAKRLRALVRQRSIGDITIKKRGSAVDVEQLRRQLRPAGPNSATFVLTRIGTKPFCFVCSEATAPEPANPT